MTQAQEDEYRTFLEGVQWRGLPLTDTAIAARIALVKKSEDLLGINVEDMVASDEKMLRTLLALRQDDVRLRRCNAIRKYYEMRWGRRFPRINDMV